VVLLITSSAATAVVATGRTSPGATALIAHAAPVPAAAQGGAVAPPDDVDPILPGQPSIPPATAPALPGPDDPRLSAIPHITAQAVTAGPRAVNVPILMYHFLRVDRNPADGLGWRLSVTPSDFALQIALLKREGFTSVSLGDVVAAVDSGAPLPARPIVLTFDDGYANFATVGAPLLARAGFTATDFVVSGFVGRPGFMSAAQVREVVALGMTIGAHTEHHVDLARVPIAVAQQEIAGSRSALQQLSGQPVYDFAYPSGRFDQQVVQLVEQAGFHDAVTTIAGMRQAAGLEYTMTRVRVSGGEGLRAFAASLSGAGQVAGQPLQAAAPGGQGASLGLLGVVASPRTPGRGGLQPS
jgi:peptidoglycan/xylan/chitin deacetylase (PgdA/CDA1 family)